MKKRVTVKTNIWVLLIVAFLLCSASAKLVYVSVSGKIDGISLKEFASKRNTTTKSIYASRGSIYASNGDALALSINSYKLIAYLESSRTVDENDPKHVVDKEYTAKMLAPVINMEESEILQYLSKEGKYQVEFGIKGNNITEVLKQKIEDLELPGIDFIESSQRYYKMGNFASYLIGYAKTNDEGNIVGELGIESYFNKELSGKDGFITYQKDLYGYQLPNVPSYEEPSVSGSNIYLTIDSNIQLTLENAVRNLTSSFQTDFVIATVMDAKTGAIVASSTSPSFNPNDLNTLDSYLNPLVSYAYEPGSTMKIFSWASAIEEGIYDGDKTYKSGSIKVADAKISDYNKVGWGTISFDKGFANSSNVAASMLALELGTGKLTNYYNKFGFGQKTGIELSGEVEGEIDFTYDSELATASFGQGITITPIQMLQALTAITNEGTMLKPYVVEKIVGEDGTISYEAKPTEVKKIMKASTAKKMQELMHEANYNGITTFYRPKKVSMMVKTGTAEIASPTGGYLTGNYDNITSVAGIFPEEDPKYIIYVAVKRIIGSPSNVGNMVTSIVDEIATYSNLIKDEEIITKEKVIELNNFISKNVDESKENLIKNNIIPVILGSGNYVINQYPLKNTSVVSTSKVFLVTNKNDYIMPDITSWSINDVKSLCNLLNIKLTFTGYGYVESQSIPKDTLITKDSILNVILTEKKKTN